MKDRKRNPDSRKNIVFNIQSIILSVLMAISLVTIIVMGLLLYHRFKLALEKTAVDNTEATVEATVDRLNADLLDIRQILNGANYNVVQQFDISSREFSEQFSLLYETNSDKIQSLALYDPKGNLIASEPVAAEKKNVKVQTQEWYKNAEDAIENIHFSTPHIQELFEDGVSAAVGDVGVVKYYIKQHPEKQFKLVPDAKFERQYFGIAVAKGNSELQAKINAGLQKIIADGTYAKIYKTWFDENVPTLPAQ